MLKLDKLVPLLKKRKRIGRGGSRGGTSGKGHKGQKARTGHKIRSGFEGGQMPLFRRLPKRGFSNEPFKKEFFILHLGRLSEFFDEDSEVTKEALIEKGIMKRKKDIKSKKLPLIKVLSDDKPVKKLIIYADAFSKSALEAIEKSGGKAKIIKEIRDRDSV
jgi:large subunit ribosomal protein L15